MKTYTIETQTNNVFTVEAAYPVDAVFLASEKIAEGVMFRVDGWFAYYKTGGVVYNASTHEVVDKEDDITLHDKSVQVARSLKELDTTFSYKGLSYDLYMEERFARFVVSVFEAGTSNRVDAYSLTASSYTGN